MVDEEAEDDANHLDEEGSMVGDGDHVDDNENPDDLEKQAQVLMTQASRRRAEIEKGRGYQQKESAEERSKRIKEMKSRMACSACRAHGKVVYGHWHDDRECPFFEESKKNRGNGNGNTQGVFVVSTAGGALSDSSEDPFMVNMVNEILQTSINTRHVDESSLALSDTCCARTVAGEKWMQAFLHRLWKSGKQFYVLEECQGFRFGPGPKIDSVQAVVVPTSLGSKDTMVYLRISVVDHDVPLLLSRRVLQDLGSVLDLGKGEVAFSQLGAKQHLITTSSGHVGFYIWDDAMQAQPDDPDLWEQLVADDRELKFVKYVRTEGEKHDPKMFPHNTLEPHNICGSDLEDHVYVCKSENQERQTAAIFSSSATCASTGDQRDCDSTSHNVQDVGAQVEERVCGGNRGSESCIQDRVDETHGGQAEGDLAVGEAGQTVQDPASGMEEIRCRGPEMCVRGLRLGGSPTSTGRPLETVEEGNLDPRDRTLVGRHERAHAPDRTGSGWQLSQSNVQELRNSSHREDQPHTGACVSRYAGRHSRCPWEAWRQSI